MLLRLLHLLFPPPLAGVHTHLPGRLRVRHSALLHYSRYR